MSSQGFVVFDITDAAHSLGDRILYQVHATFIPRQRIVVADSNGPKGRNSKPPSRACASVIQAP